MQSATSRQKQFTMKTHYKIFVKFTSPNIRDYVNEYLVYAENEEDAMAQVEATVKYLDNTLIEHKITYVKAIEHFSIVRTTTLYY